MHYKSRNCSGKTIHQYFLHKKLLFLRTSLIFLLNIKTNKKGKKYFFLSPLTIDQYINNTLK